MTTARVTHATPSNLYAHAVDRNWEADRHVPDNPDCPDDIAKQLIDSDIGRRINVS